MTDPLHTPPSADRPARPGVSARAAWALSGHFRKHLAAGRRFTAADVLALGEDGLLRVPGMQPHDVETALAWARAKARGAPKPKPSEADRFEALIARTLRAPDPAKAMEAFARVLWDKLPPGSGDRALKEVSRVVSAKPPPPNV